MHKCVVIGLAGRGKTWVKAIRAHDAFTVHGIVDASPEALAAAGDEFDIPPQARYASCEAAFASGEFDAAVVVVPHHHHFSVTRDALSAGLHCLVEKPFTMTLPEAQDLVRLAAGKRLTVQVVQNYRYKAAQRRVAEIVREGELGRLSSVVGRFHRHRPPRREAERQMPYPVLFTQSIHHLDWLLEVLPAPVAQVRSFHGRPPWSQWENPSITHVMLQCEDGVLASYQSSYESQGEITSYGGLWRFEFERGDILLDQEERVWKVAGQGESRDLVFEPAGDEKSGESWLLDALHAGITEGREPATSGRNNLKTLELLFEVLKGGSA